MKRLLYIYLAFFIIACANERKSEAPSEGVNMEKTETVLESTALEDVKETFTFQHLTEQKLQDYFDLLVLQQQHPEFIDDIRTQLHELSEDSILISYFPQEVDIKNVQQIGKTQQISDSIQKIKLCFDISTNDSVKKDSIIAIIKSKRITLDNEELISTKVVFTKEKMSN